MSATATLESSVWLHGEIASLSELEGRDRQQSRSGASLSALQPDDGRHGLETGAPRAHYATLWMHNTWKRSNEYCARAAGGTLCSAAQLCRHGAGHAPVAHRELPRNRKTWSPVSDAENSWVLLSAESSAGKGDRCTIAKQPAWGSSRKKMGEIDPDMANHSKSIVACCNAEGIIKSYLRANAQKPGEYNDKDNGGKKHRSKREEGRDCTTIGAGYPHAGERACCPKGMRRYGDGSACQAEGQTSCALWGNDSLRRCRHRGRDCTKVGTGYPSAGHTICCPKGMSRYGDGSACKAEGRTPCALWGNYEIKRCNPKKECTIVWSDYADAKKGDKLCCPDGMARYGDGSACRADGRTTCALWSNDSLPRCSDDGRDCTKVGAGYPSAGQKICCPKGMRRYGDGSACQADGRTSCALWGNFGLDRCRPKRECTVVWAGYPESGDKLCCPKGMARYGDGSACRRDGKPFCALWSNDGLARCGTRRSGGSNRVHLSFDFTSSDFTGSYATFPVRVSDPNDKSNNLLLPYLFGRNASPVQAGMLGIYAYGKFRRTFTKHTPALRVNTVYHVDLLWRPLKGTTQLVVTEVASGSVVASQTRATSAPLSAAEWNEVTASKWAVIQGHTQWYTGGGRQHGDYQGTVSNIKATVAGRKLQVVKQ